MSINTHQLHVFLVAAEALNFTQAARQLQVTQPSVSQHIQALEEHFQLPLFIRSGRSVTLTDAGQTLIPMARELVALSRRIDETMSSLRGNLQGHLAVGCSTCTGRYILPKILADFHEQYPHVRATCHITTQDQVMQMLVDGKVHVALTCNPPATQDCEFSRYTSEDVILITPSGHPWAERGEIELQDLLEGEFILPEEGSEIHTAISEGLARHGISIYQLKTIFSLGSLEAVALSVQEGLGVGFAPELLVKRLLKDKTPTVQIRGLSLHRKIYVGRNIRRTATGSQEAFWGFLTGSNQPGNPAEGSEQVRLAEPTENHTMPKLTERKL